MNVLVALAADSNSVTSDPLVIYITAIVGLALLVFGALPKIANSWTEFLAARRRTAVDRDDADIAELKRQLANLTDALPSHAKWDREVYQALMRLGEDVEPPPPLF